MKSLLLASVLLAQVAQAQLVYPETKRLNLFEKRFGTLIEDPYKWMENASDPDLWSWINEQKKVTADYLDGALHDEYSARVLEFRRLRTEQNRLTDPPATTTRPEVSPLPHDELQGRERAFIQWDTSGQLKTNVFQRESSLYRLEVRPVGGGDLMRVLITSKADNKLAGILLVKFYTFITWADDNSFYYVSDLDERIGGGRPGLFRHRVGQVQSEDQLLLAGRSSTSSLTVHQLGNAFYVQVDGTIGSLQIASGRVTNTHTLEGGIVEMTDSPVHTATMVSFRNADRGELVQLRLRDGQRSLLLKEQDFVVNRTKRLDDTQTFILGIADGAHVGAILDGSELRVLDLKEGTIDFDHKDNVLKLGIETYSEPRKVYNYDIAARELKFVAQQKFPIDLEVDKVSYTAANGQEASMWVMRKKGVKLSPTTPTILYGYGGFRVSVTPSFGIYESLPWMEKGGVFAVVTLPGSLDYGLSWWEVARVGNRTVAWESFALAGKELIRRGWTSSEHLGMLGASNGGTLVAGTMQRHPELFKAAVPLVGVMDMLNFTLFTAGKYWTADYGDPFVEADFRAIFPLSPYHNLERRPYPATMVMAASFDDRVVPMHSYKYVARLQELNTSSAPMLLYNKEWGGHARASGSDRESSRYVGAFYTFFAQQLGN
jgi:prolyl oligopeptidase